MDHIRPIPERIVVFPIVAWVGGSSCRRQGESEGIAETSTYEKQSSEKDMAEKVMEWCESLRETFRAEVNWHLTQCKDGFPLFASC